MAMRTLGVTQEERSRQGAAAARHVADWALFHMAQTVACFVSLPWEIDTAPLLQLILQSGKTLALPKAHKAGVMEFYNVTNLAHLQPGRFGVREPAGGEIIPPQAISLLILPALAVDAKGGRLGHGGGYYDRYLTKTTCPRAALVLMEQVVSHVPCEEHDFLVQWIITGEGIAPIPQDIVPQYQSNNM